MASLRSTPFTARPGLLGALLLLATLALAGALAQQATRAAASHRATAEGMLGDYAAIAAWQFTREARSWLGFGMSQAENVIAREIPAPGKGPLPGPEMLRRVLAEKECDCVTAGFARTVFRVTRAPAAQLDADGDPLSAATRTALLDLFARDTTPAQGPRRWRMLVPGQPALPHADDMVLLWRIPEGATAGARTPTRAFYGMVVEVAQIRRPLEGAVGDAELLPASLTGSMPRDSLVSLAVGGPGSPPLFRHGRTTSPQFAAIDTVGLDYGALNVTATIRPEAASVLIIGGLPATRIPQIIALLALTLAVGIGALLLLRREQQLARLRDDFVSGVSHELRTPLTQIRTMSELLESGGFRTEAERQRATSVIHREALRLTNLVDNVLQFATLRRRPKHAPAQSIRLEDVIAEAREAFLLLAATRGSKLEVHGRTDILVRGDRDALIGILRNLLENALKYGPPDQTVRIRIDRPNGTARLAVEDQGPGVPIGARERIWRPYHRLERDQNAPAGGSGLGLAVVAELTALCGGRAWVEDAPGGGARFVVELPLASDPVVGA
ncbi:MAG: HAMP domain-containing sensor histidine kinase [Gemmatimonadota bacterium]